MLFLPLIYNSESILFLNESTQGSKSEEAKVSRRRRQVQSKSDNTPEVDNQSKTKKEKKITKSKTNAHPSKKFILFVSNLSDETLGKNLRIHFNPVARVKVAQVNIFSRKHTGTGYVTFYSEEDALKACTELHGSMLDGNQISCTLEIPVKEPKEEKIQLEVSGLSTTDSTIPTENIVKVEVPTKLFVKNFKYEITQEELLELANRFGTAVSVELLTSRKGKSLGQAIFEYSTEEEASNALESLNQMEFNERHLLVRRYFAT